MVPISALKKMRGNPLSYEGEELQKLSEDIKQNGLRNPGIIDYYQHSKTASLGEGNHRLAALEMAGFTHMPATVIRIAAHDVGFRGVPVRGVTPNQHNYVPGNMKPSEIMDWDDA